MSKSAKPEDGARPKDEGMAVIRRTRRASLEKALRSGSSPDSERPNAAAAWGSALQREARDQAPAEPARPAPSRRPVEPAGRPAGGVSGEPSPRPVEPSPRPVEPSPRARPLTELLPPIRSSPSTASPPDLEPEVNLNHQADLLAKAHDEREAREAAQGTSLGTKAKAAVSLGIVLLAVFLSIWPALDVVSARDEERRLVLLLNDAAARLHRDARLAGALQSRDLKAMRDIFLAERAAVTGALLNAGFPATPETVRVRLASGGKAIALSADFERDDGEVTAATATTGAPAKVPGELSLLDVVFEGYLLNVVTAMAVGLGAVASLWLAPLWLARRLRSGGRSRGGR